MKAGWLYRPQDIRVCVEYLRKNGIDICGIRSIGVSGSGRFKYVSRDGNLEVIAMQGDIRKEVRDMPKAPSYQKHSVREALNISALENQVKEHHDWLADEIKSNFQPGEVDVEWGDHAECTVTWRKAVLPLSFLSVPVPSDVTSAEFEQSAKQYLKRIMPNFETQLRLEHARVGRDEKKRGLVQDALGEVKGKVLTILPDGSNINVDIIIYKKNVKVQFHTSVHTPYGRITNQTESVLRDSLSGIVWADNEDGESVIKNRAPIQKRLVRDMLDSVWAGHGQVKVPEELLPEDVRDKLRQYENTLTSFPAWFVSQSRDIGTVYVYDFSKKSGYFKTPYFMFFLGADGKIGLSKNTAAGSLVAALLKDEYINERLAYGEAKLKKYGISLERAAGRGAGTGNSKFNATISDTCYPNQKFEFQKDLAAWEQNFDKMVSTIVKEYQREQEELHEAFEKFYGNALAVSILELLSKNSYITESAIAENLRGLKVKLDAKLKDAKLSGKFNLIPTDSIKDFCTTLNHAGLLTYKYHHGTYGDFYTVHIMPTGEKLLSTRREDAYHLDSFDDFHFNERLSSPTRTENPPAWYLSLVSKNVPMTAKCMWLDVLERIFSSAPPEIIKVLQMQKAVENDPLQVKFLTKMIRAGKAKKGQEEEKKEDFLSALAMFSKDFFPNGREQPPVQERESL